ncbi:hypothetical protein ED733_002299 [Metarhizium rileyi]|uniref:Protein kinase domain-containing protein n=1 Tax=Metarhizium rileyi (strain RCEF 4871) TaxID=1649241 RepID=A0A5C6G3M4_METRR|nr:hypothetical protein ED733_002299 [Metarhizium rileyi]
MVSPFLDAKGNTIPEEQILGSGSRAVVIVQNGVAVKMPLRCPWSTAYDVQANIDSIRREQTVYRRLQQPPADDARSSGVVRCVGVAPEATHLAYMANGDLQTHLATTRPSAELQLQWFYEMARALDYVHERCVLVADIASRNFLLDARLSLKMCDFSEASLLPLGSDMRAADDNGYTAQIDIGLLGAVMYEIATGIQCKVDLYKDNDPADGRAYWPARGALPDTESLALGGIIEGCWSGRFPSAGHLSHALEALHVPAPSAPTWLRDSIIQRPVVAIIGALGLVMYTFMARRHRS